MMRPFLLFFVGLFLVTFTSAHAAVLSVNANPGDQEASLARTSSFVVTWEVELSPNQLPVTIVGQAGEFRLGGTPVATTRTISRKFPHGLQGTYLIVETVSVPRHVAIQAYRTNQTLEFVRFFADDGVFDQSGEVIITVSGTNAAEAGIAALNLMFEDGTDYRAVAKGGELRAQAIVSSTGGGILRGVWEIAAPFGGVDHPVYRILQNVTRPITATPEMTIISPPLPTDMLGRVRVRFRVIEPDVSADTPVIDYIVTETGDDPLNKPFEPKIPASQGGGMKPSN